MHDIAPRSLGDLPDETILCRCEEITVGQVRQAIARAKGARIAGTPEMMVAGKYRITTRKAGSQANMLKIADFLIEKERAAGQGSSPAD